jgi:hypothetical protein
VKNSAALFLAVLAFLLLLGVGGVGYWVWQRRVAAARAETVVAPPPGEVVRPNSVTPSPKRPSITGLSAAEKTARVEKIRRDYDEITSKLSADYAAAGATFPGGLNAFLRQLALLAREKHADLAALLTPRELEDVEMRDTNAGQTVSHLLGDTAATEPQRRAAFELQAAFEDKFALTFDLTPPALLEREKERQATQANIRRVLGDDLFAAWLRGEGTDFETTAAYARQQGLAASVPLDLWAVKNDFQLARLELKARTDLSPAQRADAEAALINETNTRVAGVIGPAGLAGGGRDVLGWLPRPPASANPPPGR